MVCVCLSKLQFNTATVNVPEAHLEPRSQFNTQFNTSYSEMPCSHAFVCEQILLFFMLSGFCESNKCSIGDVNFS